MKALIEEVRGDKGGEKEEGGGKRERKREKWKEKEGRKEGRKGSGK